MKQISVWATLVAMVCLWAFAAPPARAQQGRPAAPTVAILDLTYIFKNHPRFQALTNDMRRDVDAAENAVKTEQQAVQQLSTRLEEFRKGTPEFKSLEEEIARRVADIKLKVSIQQRTFLEQEAKNYFSIYQEVLGHVKTYAEANGITMVLRFNGDPIDTTDPQEVLKELNKSVIYYHRAIDITPYILERCAASGGGAAPVNPGPAGRPFPQPAPGAQPSGPGSVPTLPRR